MGDADRKAFEDWVSEIRPYHTSQFDIWKAAIEWRDSQVGEPVAWQFFDPQSNQWFLGSNMPHHKDDTIKAGYEVRDLYTIPTTAQINQQLMDFVQNWLKLQGNDDNYMTAKAKAALAAAKEQSA